MEGQPVEKKNTVNWNISLPMKEFSCFQLHLSISHEPWRCKSWHKLETLNGWRHISIRHELRKESKKKSIRTNKAKGQTTIAKHYPLETRLKTKKKKSASIGLRYFFLSLFLCDAIKEQRSWSKELTTHVIPLPINYVKILLTESETNYARVGT